MSKVCFFTVQWLEEARYTADNLLIAKMMSDYGQPLNPDLNFYVQNSNNDSSLFFEALKVIFDVKSEVEEEEKTVLLLSNKEITSWLQLTEKIRNTNMHEAFRMVQKGLESTLSSSSHWFDGEMEGTLTETGVQLNVIGTTYYMMYHEFLEEIIQFKDELKKQLQIWEDIYNEQTEGNHRNTNQAS
jgi:pyrroloquinoline quinone (PQQ) biosynthesis protein C